MKNNDRVLSKDDDTRWVLGLEPNGRTKACTICSAKDAWKYANYYRSLRENGIKRFYSVRIFTYDEMIEHDMKVENRLYELERRQSYVL